MKKILIVSPYFAPENSVASIRFTKIAKYLQKMGHDITVICTQMNAEWVVDKTLEEDLSDFKKVIRIKYPEFLYYAVKRRLGAENSQIKQNKKENAKKKESKGESSLVWTYTHFCSMLLGRRFINYVKKQGEKYDVVITTYSPISGHMLGNYMKKHHMCTTWIEDFRDPLTLYCGRSFLASFTHFHGVKLMKRSDCITTVSKGSAKKLIEEARQFGLDIKNKIKIIHNGYDPDDRKGLEHINTEKNKLKFVYCGTIYDIGGQVKNDISPLFEALSDLMERKEIDRKFVMVEYAGGNEDVFYRFAQKYHIEDIVYSHGKVSRDESLNLQRESDIIIVPVWNNKGETGIISGKFFETLLVRRNVLSIITGNQKNSELAALIGQIQCGFAYEEINGDKCNMGQLKKWIVEKYKEKKMDGELMYCSNGEEQKYSHPYLAKKFERLWRTK